MQRLDGARGIGPTVTLVYFNAGGGHRAAARAIKAELDRQYPQWHTVLVDLFEVLDPEHRFKRMTGFAPESYYNKRLSTGFTLGLQQELKVLQAMIRVAHPQLVRRLVKYWQQTHPRLVVSLVPNFNRAIGASLTRYRHSLAGQRQPPFVTIMTDLADYPPHFWIEPSFTEHVICGTEHACAQAVAQGIASDRIHRVSGMVLSPRFYPSVGNGTAREDALQRDQARLTLGFKPGEPVGCVMFGGHGSSVMKRIAMQLSDRPLILICGRNEVLKHRLQRLPGKTPRVVVGFTDDVASWMRLADYFIGKPGPGSISEALHCGLPVIVTRNVWTMPQERFNTDWVRDHQFGHVVSSFAQIPKAVDHMLSNLPLFRRHVSNLQNRALYEIVDIFKQLLDAAERSRDESLVAQAID